MKVKVPSVVRISSYLYEIVEMNNLEQDYKLLGQCLTDKGVIKIESCSIPSIKDVTLLHELVHAINDVYRCELEEANIDRIAQGLADVFKNSFNIEFEWEAKKA